MPGPRLPMRRIRDVLRLSAAGMSKLRVRLDRDHGFQRIVIAISSDRDQPGRRWGGAHH